MLLQTPLQLRWTQDAEANPLRVLKNDPPRSSDGQFITTVIGTVPVCSSATGARKRPSFATSKRPLF
jgi:hypothetical protein